VARGWITALLALTLVTPACSFRVEGLPIADLEPAPDLRPVDLFESDSEPPDMGDDLTAPADLSLAGVLTGLQASYTGTTDLTTEGKVDWAHYGLSAPSDVNRKAMGGSLIAAAATGMPGRFDGYTRSFSWTDGNPVATVANSTTGIFVADTGNGFTITVPASTTPRTLKLYLSSYATTSTLVGHLSDGSAPDYTDVKTIGNTLTYLSYALTYKSASATGSLTVTWYITSAVGSNAISLLGATLF
jgi:hypothetical protein